MITFEEKQQKENKIIGDFRTMLHTQLGDAGGNGSGSGSTVEN